MSAGEKAPRPLDLLRWIPSEPPSPSGEAAELATELFCQHRAGVARYLFSLGLPNQECEEIVQDVFLALFVHLRAERPRHNLQGWVFRVAHNLGLKRRRSGACEADWDAASFDAIDPAPSAEERVAASQHQVRLRNVVAALDDLDRQCLFLRAEGLRYRQIADIAGISLGGVAASLARSFERLRRASERENRDAARSAPVLLEVDGR